MDAALIGVTCLARRDFYCVIDTMGAPARGGGGGGELFTLGDGWPIYSTLGGDHSPFVGD